MSDPIESMTAELKHVRPDLFDDQGRLVYNRVTAKLRERFGGMRYIGKAEIEELDRSGPLSRCHLTVPADDSGGLHYCYEARGHEGEHRCPCSYAWEADDPDVAAATGRWSYARDCYRRPGIG